MGRAAARDRATPAGAEPVRRRHRGAAHRRLQRSPDRAPSTPRRRRLPDRHRWRRSSGYRRRRGHRRAGLARAHDAAQRPCRPGAGGTGRRARSVSGGRPSRQPAPAALGRLRGGRARASVLDVALPRSAAVHGPADQRPAGIGALPGRLRRAVLARDACDQPDRVRRVAGRRPDGRVRLARVPHRARPGAVAARGLDRRRAVPRAGGDPPVLGRLPAWVRAPGGAARRPVGDAPPGAPGGAHRGRRRAVLSAGRPAGG